MVEKIPRIVKTNFKTKSPAVARTADRTGCQWPSRSSRSMIFILSERLCATSYYWLIVGLTLVLSLTIIEIWPVFHWKMHIFSAPFIQAQIWKCSPNTSQVISMTDEGTKRRTTTRANSSTVTEVGLRSANNSWDAKWTAQHESWNAGSSR